MMLRGFSTDAGMSIALIADDAVMYAEMFSLLGYEVLLKTISSCFYIFMIVMMTDPDCQNTLTMSMEVRQPALCFLCRLHW